MGAGRDWAVLPGRTWGKCLAQMVNCGKVLPFCGTSLTQLPLPREHLFHSGRQLAEPIKDSSCDLTGTPPTFGIVIALWHFVRSLMITEGENGRYQRFPKVLFPGLRI